MLTQLPFYYEKKRLSDLLQLMMLADSKARAETQDSLLGPALYCLSSTLRE